MGDCVYVSLQVCVCVCVCRQGVGGGGGRVVGQLAASGSSAPRGYPAWRKFFLVWQLGPGCQPRQNSQTCSDIHTHTHTNTWTQQEDTQNWMGGQKKPITGWKLSSFVHGSWAAPLNGPPTSSGILTCRYQNFVHCYCIGEDTDILHPIIPVFYTRIGQFYSSMFASVNVQFRKQCGLYMARKGVLVLLSFKRLSPVLTSNQTQNSQQQNGWVSKGHVV